MSGPAGRASALEARAIRAALGLLREDPRAVEGFDITVRGFFNSFRAAIYALPAFAVVLALEHRLIVEAPTFQADRFSEWRFAGAETVGFALTWVLAPLLLLAFLRITGRRQRFVPLVVALNWANALAATVIAVPALLRLSGLVPDTAIAFVLLGLFVWMLRYIWFVVRMAGKFGPGEAAGIVGMLVGGELVLAQLVDGLSHLW